MSNERRVIDAAAAAVQPETFRLNDGRLLGFAEYGEPGGSPVLAFHGIPGSRLTFAFADGAARRLRLRVISPERPGIGLSSPLPQRTILDWPGLRETLVDVPPLRGQHMEALEVLDEALLRPVLAHGVRPNSDFHPILEAA